jgi:hypothetical protein
LHFGLNFRLLWLCGFAAGLMGLCQLRAVASPAIACDAAGRMAEQNRALPANLLVSIGMVESGRIDPASGRIAAWPWSVNVDGSGYYFADERDASEFAQMAEGSGARDVDVGCFQVSLQAHPGAFASMDSAFDPASNAAFAAAFLQALQRQTGSWDQAVADYHSALPAFGLPYQRRVMRQWRLLSGVEDFNAAGVSGTDPSVILAGPATRLVRVFTLTGETGDDATAWPPLRPKNLPVLITP